MTEQTRIFRTERIWLKQTEQLRKLCHISKNLFNEANYLVRHAFFNEKKWIRLSQLHQELLSSVNFQQLPIPTARKVLQLVDKAWKSFFAASIDWKSHPKKYFQQPRIPKYKPKNGQFQVAFEKNQVIFSKQTLRPRRVLLDIGCDDPALIKALTQLGLEVELVWRHAADLLNYEIIEICTAQYIDILVSTNSHLLTPPEE